MLLTFFFNNMKNRLEDMNRYFEFWPTLELWTWWWSKGRISIATECTLGDLNCCAPVRSALASDVRSLFDHANLSHASRCVSLQLRAIGTVDLWLWRPVEKSQFERDYYSKEPLKCMRASFGNGQNWDYTIILSDRTFAKENGNQLLGE